MSDIGAGDMLFPDDVFGMGGGYVLNFSDGAFADSFAQGLNLDIGDRAYAVTGRDFRTAAKFVDQVALRSC